MTAAASAPIVAPWGRRSYRTIVSARGNRDRIEVCFADGSCGSMGSAAILPAGAMADWDRMTASTFVVTIPTQAEPVELSWFTVRTLTDPAFESYVRQQEAEGNQTIGALVAARRREDGLSVEELARQSGLDPNVIAAIEAARVTADIETLDRFLKPMGTTFDDLLDAENVAPAVIS